jgi:acetate kinase
MKILVLNSGSSSVKFRLIDTDEERIERNDDRLLARGQIERIGSAEAILEIHARGQTSREVAPEVLDHRAGIERILSELTRSGAIRERSEIEAVGHRVVHGGDLRASHLVNDEVLRAVESTVEIAPLHNPHNLRGYRACRELFPDLPQVMVFDTAFHQTMPPRAATYALPSPLAKRLRIRRYGFHGLSHRYVAYRYRTIVGRAREDLNLITCHLGNGCSMTAIEHGHSVDTTMGFTPVEGLVMGTRSGDLDPSVILYVMSKEEMAPHEAAALLNRQSGLLGISGESNDMRELLASAAAGHRKAMLAIEIFCYRVRKYVGAYTAVLGEVDALVFTGGIGENSAHIRELCCERLEAVGFEIDPHLNAQAAGREMEISRPESRSRIWVIPTDEELLIARDTYRVVTGAPSPS